MSLPSSAETAGRRRWISIVIAVLLVLLVAGISYAIMATRGSGPEAGPGPTAESPTAASASVSDRTPSASPSRPGRATPSSPAAKSSTPSSNRSPGTAAPTTTARPKAPPRSTKPAGTASSRMSVVPTKAVKTTQAPIDEPGKLGNGVTVKVSGIESVKGVAHGPGEIAGPALRVSITVNNDTAKPVSMGLALANLYYGREKSPARELSGPGAKALTASIRAGDSATGAYVFSVPTSERKHIAVEFSYTTRAPVIVFSGSA